MEYYKYILQNFYSWLSGYKTPNKFEDIKNHDKNIRDNMSFFKVKDIENYDKKDIKKDIEKIEQKYEEDNERIYQLIFENNINITKQELKKITNSIT